jgi:hypothetical protein
MPSRRVVGRAGPSCRQEEAQCHEGCNKVLDWPCLLASLRVIRAARRRVGRDRSLRAVAGHDECQVPRRRPCCRYDPRP